jgi:hypothetical protein
MGIQVEGSRAKVMDFVLRECLEDGSVHFYRKAELADPGIETLVPWCQLDELYPARHPRIEVVSRFVKSNQMCSPCYLTAEASRQTRGGF